MTRFAIVSVRLSLLIGCLLPVRPSPSRADWVPDSNIGGTLLGSGPGTRFLAKIAADGAGGAIVAWEDYRSGPANIYAQHVNAAGVALWTAGGLGVCISGFDQTNVALTSDGAGGAILVWEDYRSGNYDIYAQRVNAAGAAQWAANGVPICVSPNDQGSPVIVSDGAGGAIILWGDFRNPPSDDLYAQRVNGAGVTQWAANGVAICTAANNQIGYSLVADGAGGAISTWQDSRGANADIYAQRIDAGGVPKWTANGVALCTATGDQQNATTTTDQTGGAIVAWSDLRSGGSDIYAQRVSSAGVPLWTVNGLALCTASGGQGPSVIASDGSGGAILSWPDPRNAVSLDIYAQRVGPTGVPQWATNGVDLCPASGLHYQVAIAADGSGGAYLSWRDSRSGTYDIYAQRVDATGAPLWIGNGMAVCTAFADQQDPVMAADGAGGAILAWLDYRNSAWDIYGQRIDQYGYLGNPAPGLPTVRDVPNDQGGAVKVSWSASYLDAQPYHQIDSYSILRAAPPNQGGGYSWEFVASQPAFHVASYSYVAPTTGDSVGAGNPRSVFMIVANHARPEKNWYSAADSGYSVDNIAPLAPTPFTGAYIAGATHLHWGANHESDLAGYRLYRGSSSSFVPAPGNLISAQPDTGFGDAGAAGRWYKLSAVDAHGNESLYAILGPTGTLDAPGASAARLELAPPAPNPSSGEGTTFAFSLPVKARVALAIFDEQGRRVRELVNGTLDAGRHLPRWDGADDAGRMLPSGIYFVRLEAMGRSIHTRFALVR